ncbi:MAG TPA: hypothetical protein VFM96_14205 [Gaiellaceae bacterium]|nr:hypothetical protein [Gaiellaceae bacterium]
MDLLQQEELSFKAPHGSVSFHYSIGVAPRIFGQVSLSELQVITPADGGRLEFGVFPRFTKIVADPPSAVSDTTSFLVDGVSEVHGVMTVLSPDGAIDEARAVVALFDVPPRSLTTRVTARELGLGP